MTSRKAGASFPSLVKTGVKATVKLFLSRRKKVDLSFGRRGSGLTALSLL